MKSPFRLPAALAASCLALLASPVLADGNAASRLSNVQFSTLDLTPDDGAAAGYEIVAIANSQVFASYSQRGNPGEQNFFLEPYQPGVARVDYGPSFGEGSTSGAIGALDTRARGTAELDTFGHAGAHSIQRVLLTLRPNTVLIVGGHVDTLATAHFDQMRYDAVSRVDVGLIDAAGRRVDMAQISYTSVDGGIDELHDDFALRYENSSANDLAVTLDLHAQAAVFAIPEPASWAMLSAGLLLLGAAGKRRTASRGK
ncbi:PEP-CTERM sorting domain-containing protein [[Empedobacter] haloabium]|uniref:PEP-CTERM sorting domain-containing protein n=1 Tax=[Empedobacter] haloabium TaxID=592317 RepID=A0ABZ1UI85_9BURK